MPVQIVNVPEQHIELLRLAHKQMREARIMYEGVSRLIVNDLLSTLDLGATSQATATLDPERMYVTITSEEEPK